VNDDSQPPANAGAGNDKAGPQKAKAGTPNPQGRSGKAKAGTRNAKAGSGNPKAGARKAKAGAGNAPAGPRNSRTGTPNTTGAPRNSTAGTQNKRPWFGQRGLGGGYRPQAWPGYVVMLLLGAYAIFIGTLAADHHSVWILLAIAPAAFVPRLIAMFQQR
jgi:hypothetical protein